MEMRDRREPFDLSLPVWYRAADEPQWHHGTTEQVSVTGALIHCEAAAPAGEQIAVIIALPSSAGCLVGRGRVLAATPSADHDTFAVAVDGYQIEHRETALIAASLVLQGCQRRW